MAKSGWRGPFGLTRGMGATAVGAVSQVPTEQFDAPVTLVPAGLEAELAQSFGLGELTRGGRTFVLDDFRQVLAQDAIPPIYNPALGPASAAPLGDDDLVLGVEIGGESRAYPVGTLNGREMVNDEVGGVPILVSW